MHDRPAKFKEDTECRNAPVPRAPLTAVAIVSSADGRRCRITDGEPGPGEAIERRVYFKPSHAELLLSAIDLDGWTDQAPAAVVALIERAAATLGARYQSPEQLREAAEEVVAEVTARVDVGRQNGDLKQVNAQYKRYRQQQMAKAEKAMPYAKFLEQFTASIVRDVATTGLASFWV